MKENFEEGFEFAWSVNTSLHCDIIIYISSQFPLFSIKKGLSNLSESVHCHRSIYHMKNWNFISANLIIKIDVLLDLINVRAGNISCNGLKNMKSTL